MFPLAKHAVEKSRVDQLYDILAGSKEPKTFYELTDQVFTKEEIEADQGEKLARLYTTLSTDGRFLSIGKNLWALRNWYPLEQREDDVARKLGKEDGPKKRNKVAEDGFDDYDDEDLNEEDEDEEMIDDDDEDSADDDYTDSDDETVQRYRENAKMDDEE
ncbi:DNA-directed RNA polymerase subunit delta [Sporolactobacillus sp. THM7-7]|nr:DNA-directed RNA polymerase subunit delta [Sporolactobacillus sp. THM7-7]